MFTVLSMGFVIAVAIVSFVNPCAPKAVRVKLCPYAGRELKYMSPTLVTLSKSTASYIGVAGNVSVDGSNAAHRFPSTVELLNAVSSMFPLVVKLLSFM